MTPDPHETATHAPPAPAEEDERPWGRFRCYAKNEPCTVKIIEVAAGERLSLQRHRDRDELWVALDDSLVIEIDGRTIEAASGDEYHVPRGSTHRIAARGRSGRVLEVAFGDFREDDIERLEDDYGRS